MEKKITQIFRKEKGQIVVHGDVFLDYRFSYLLIFSQDAVFLKPRSIVVAPRIGKAFFVC